MTQTSESRPRTSPLRIGAIGTSSIVERTIAAASVVPELRFTHVLSRDAERGAAFASRHGLTARTDLQGLLADVDAVYVASPNGVHAEQIEAALRAGRHVLAEKPVVGTAAEFDRLCALADAQGVVLLENLRTAHDPVLERAIHLLPTLGPVRRASFSLSQRSARYDKVLAGEHVNVFDPALGGGALADLGCYVLHPLVRLLGVPDALTGHLVALPTGADGAGAAVASYPGAVAEVAWSKITGNWLPSFVEGELGTLFLDHITELTEVRVQYLDGRRLAETPAKHADNISYQLSHFAAVVAGREDAAADRSWTRAVLDLTDRLRG